MSFGSLPSDFSDFIIIHLREPKSKGVYPHPHRSDVGDFAYDEEGKTIERLMVYYNRRDELDLWVSHIQHRAVGLSCLV